MTEPLKNLQDIAAICSVSVSTVSRVLNHEPGISKETVKRVMEVVQRYNFSPSRRKRPISRSQLRLLLIVPDASVTLDNPFFDIGELLRSVAGAFARERKTIETFSFSQLSDTERVSIGAADGVIFAFGDVDRPVLESLRDRSVPYIFLNRILEEDNYVSCNHYKGTLRLTEHLSGRGYKRVGYLGCSGIPVNVDRKRGYLAGMFEASGTVDRSLITEVAGIGDVTRETVGSFVDRGCDAVMCFNDNFSIRFIKGLLDIGRKVPDDMAVTGFDDSPLRRVFSPSVTTISLSTFEMGFFAARWLRDNIQHRESRRIQLEVNGTLIIGQSTVKGGAGE